MQVLSIRQNALIEGTESEIERMKKRLVVFNSFHPEKSLRLFKEDGKPNRIYIPRGIINRPVDETSWERINVEHKIILKEDQKELLKKILDYLDRHPSGVILQAPTGNGKTILGIYLAHLFGLKTLIVVPRERIFYQWIERIKAFTDCNDVGIIRGSDCWIDPPYVVAMLHTLSNGKHEHVYDKFGTVIFDEVHTIPTKHFSKTADMFWCKTRIGLSATPTRRDGMDNVFLWHIGGIVSLESTVNVKPIVYIFNVYSQSINDYRCFTYTDRFIIHRFIKKLMTSDRRNRLLNDIITKMYKKGHDILVLTDSIDHIQLIKRGLVSGRVIKPTNIGTLTGTIKEVDKKVIIGTYGSAGLGLDIPRLSCLILATPRAEIIQAVGRVLRGYSKLNPIVIDFVDTGSARARAWAQKRKKYYKEIAKEIIEVRIQ